MKKGGGRFPKGLITLLNYRKTLDQAYVDAFVGFVIDPALVDEDGILLPSEDEECNGECEGCESKGAEQCKKGKKRK